MSPRNSGKLRIAAHRGQAEGAIGWIILSVLAVLIILPLGAVLLQIVSPGFFGNTEKADGMSLLFEVFEKPLWYKALGNSMSLGIWTTFFGTAFGAFLANFRVKWEFKTAKLLDIAAWILMIMPSFIIAQGWVYFASGNGIARSWLHWNNINSLVFSFPGLVFIMVLNKFPFAYVTIKAALEWKPERLSLAARMNGASPWEEWKTVQAPLCIPAYCSAAILIFMDTIGDFGLPAAISGVYRFPTLPYAIYTALYSSPIRLDMAGVLSFYLVLIIIAAMIVQYRIIGKKRYDFFDTGTVKAVPVRPAFGVGIILDFLGASLFRMRFETPMSGIWRILIRNSLDIRETFHLWLPVRGFITDETYFLRPDPDTIITDPGNARYPITVTAYDHTKNSIYIHASRGYSLSGRIKPDLAAPGVNILGASVSGRRLTRMSGTSVSAAHLAGAAAILLNWGVLNANYPYLNTPVLKSIFVRGAQRNPALTYPNREFGYGTLDLYEAFLHLRNL